MPLTPAGRAILDQLTFGALNEYELYTELEDATLAPFAIRAELRALRRHRPPLVAETYNGRWELTDYAAARLADGQQLRLGS